MSSSNGLPTPSQVDIQNTLVPPQLVETALRKHVPLVEDGNGNIEVTHESQIFPSSPARKGKKLVTDPATLQVPPYYPDTPAVREELARMYDNIADMDVQVGELLKQLEDDGLAENTIVFYWSDHGDGVPRSKRSLYDSGLRVPLMIRWPTRLGGTAAPGSVRDELVSFIDLAPTVLALAGVAIPVHLQGRVLLGPKAAPAPGD